MTRATENHGSRCFISGEWVTTYRSSTFIIFKSNGSNSQFGSLTAAVGGGNGNAASGGSGGGGTGNYDNNAGGSGTAGQGFAGGPGMAA